MLLHNEMVVALKPNGACALFAALHRHVGEEATLTMRNIWWCACYLQARGLVKQSAQHTSVASHRHFSEAANTNGNVSVPTRDPSWLLSFPELQETDRYTRVHVFCTTFAALRSLLAMGPSCTTIPMCQSWTWNLYNLNVIKYLYL